MKSFKNVINYEAKSETGMISGLDRLNNETRERINKIIKDARFTLSELFESIRKGTPVNLLFASNIVDEIIESYNNGVAVLAYIKHLKSKEDYTYMHSLSVCAMMIQLSRSMQFDHTEERLVGLGGLLIDLGKMAIDPDIINKPGPLSDDEMAKMKRHPESGYFFLMDCDEVDDIVLDICLHHHERLDGSGYPHGLKGDKISIYARMAAICDVYDAITSNRPYGNAWDNAEAIKYMTEWKGQFDPDILRSMINCVGIYPVGSLVRLKSDRLAVVVQQNEIPNKPIVKIIYAIKSKLETVPVLVSLHGAMDEIICIENPNDWSLGDNRHLIEV